MLLAASMSGCYSQTRWLKLIVVLLLEQLSGRPRRQLPANLRTRIVIHLIRMCQSVNRGGVGVAGFERHRAASS